MKEKKKTINKNGYFAFFTLVKFSLNRLEMSEENPPVEPQE